MSPTDESGFFRLSGLPYVNNAETTYRLTACVGIEGFPLQDRHLRHQARRQRGEERRDRGGESVKLSGYVMYDGTSIPVQGVSFMVDGYEVHGCRQGDH